MVEATRQRLHVELVVVSRASAEGITVDQSEIIEYSPTTHGSSDVAILPYFP
jgi:hypothetical protein